MLFRWKPTRSTLWAALIVVVGASHPLVLVLCQRQMQASNLVQLAAAFLVVSTCLLRVRQASEPYFRAAWSQLAVGFIVYTAAQAYFAWCVIWKQSSPQYPSPADFLWMMFAFPILLVTVRRRSGVGWQWSDWLDAGQACTFFSLLYVLVFSQRAVISVSLAYELQSVALILSWLIRFSGTEFGPERRFFRDIGCFLVLYGVFSSVGNRWTQFELPAHGWVGLCWSLPLLFFCALTLTASEEPAGIPIEEDSKFSLPGHLHGLSAFGLSVMSIAAGATLALHHSKAGIVALLVSFLIFATRTCLRESQLHVAHSTMRQAVMYDPVTGLGNRTRLMVELERLLADTAANEVGLLFIDLDRFKMINDSLGHAVGDKLLSEVGKILIDQARTCDLVVRLAGDEFVVVLPSVELGALQSLAERVVRRFRLPVFLDERVLHISASVGCAISRPGTSGHELLRDADCAMYAAKKQGKNRVRSFHDGVGSAAERRLYLETDLRKALGSDEILVYFQPIYSLKNQDVPGFEALARWESPVHGFVSPSEFVTVAEDSGLIVALGTQVLRKACSQVHRWNKTFGKSYSVSVNVSARQFEDPDLLENIGAILVETGLAPTMLRLEITETALLTGTEAVRDVLRGIREMGISVSLDDFLTGYSSLSYLLDYSCDLVKIDKSFVRALDKDVRRAELVRTVIQLGRNLGLGVIAEGVETEEELVKLEEMGCDLIQGFLFSKPLSPDHINTMLRNGSSVWESDLAPTCLVRQDASVLSFVDS